MWVCLCIRVFQWRVSLVLRTTPTSSGLVSSSPSFLGWLGQCGDPQCSASARAGSSDGGERAESQVA